MSLYAGAIRKLLKLLGTPGAVRSAFSWTPFSFTAYKLVGELKAIGVDPKLVIDIGANKGQFSRAIRETFGREVSIYGYEPLSEVYNQLRRNFEGDGNALFYRYAVGAESGSAEININAFSQSSSLLRLGRNHLSAFPKAREIGLEEVKVVRLDDALRDVVWSFPSLLKIDVQGYEAKVLDGAPSTLGRVDYVLIEVGLVPLYTEEPTYDAINNRLKEAGFEFVSSLATLWDEKKGIAIQMDALYKRKT